MNQSDYLRMLDEEMETAPRGRAKANLNQWLKNNDPTDRINRLNGTVARSKYGT